MMPDGLAIARGRWALDLFRGAIDELFPRVIDVELAAAREQGWRLDLPEAYCHRCGLAVGPGAVTPRGCSRCLDQRLPWDRLVRLGAYREPLSTWIVSMKFARCWTWGPWLGEQLAQVVPPASPGVRTVVCPVPLHWRRRWRRGYNQTHLMARELGRRRGWPVVELLRRARHRPPQTTVPASGRPGNVRGCFIARPIDLTGWHVWLVDDVKTTGSTLVTCARQLRRAGAASVNIAVAAVAEHR